MAKEYLERLEEIAGTTASDISGSVNIECKHFFGGAALYAEGRICISLTPVGLAVKLPEKTRDRLLGNKETVPLRYFPNGPVKKDYVLFPNVDAEGSTVLQGYLRESIEYVLTLPKPIRRRK
ncbi:MAG: hypothetical protein O2913_01020 [Chloroflexi bacterium]|nr:hypothetical protein [Chloroflexota bacterium]